jgi:hypothetical protein
MMDDELGRLRRKAVKLIKAISRLLYNGTGKNHEKSQDN